MSERLSCPSCGQPMSAESAVCPHCGRRRPVEPGSGSEKGKLSPDEVRALLALERTASPPPPPNVFARLFLPHPATTGAAHTAEILLTLVALPALLGALVAILFARRLLGKLEPSRSGEYGLALLTGVFGGSVLWSVLPLFDLCSSGGALAAGGLCLVALLLRARVRASAGSASGDFFR